MPEAVVDASAIVDLLLGGATGDAVDTRLQGHVLHAPAHLDAEVLSALGRLHRSKDLSARGVAARLAHLRSASILRHPLPPLLEPAWALRERLRLSDALYAALSAAIDAPIITTDRRFASAVSSAELIGG